MKLYAIKDTKVGFLSPFTYPNDFVAIREFGNIVNSDNSTNVSVNYKDMELYSLGTYDTDSGLIDSECQFLVNGLNVKESV